MIASLSLGVAALSTGVFFAAFFYLLWWGRAENTSSLPPGWTAILGGFGLLLLGNGLASLPMLASLSASAARESALVLSLIGKGVAFPAGCLLLLRGIRRWRTALQRPSQAAEQHPPTADPDDCCASTTPPGEPQREAQEPAPVPLQHLLAANPAVLYRRQVRKPYTITFISDNLRTQLGYDPREFLSDPDFWLHRLHPQDRDRVLAEQEALFQNEVICCEYRLRHKEGRGHYRWIRDEQRLIRHTDGKPLEIVGSWLDITERKRAEQTQRRLSTILEASTDFVALTDSKGIVRYINRGGCQMLGITAREIIGHPLTALNPPWANSLIRREALPEAKRRGWWRGETALLNREGREIPVSQLLLVHWSTEGEFEFFSTVARDIRERKAYEAQLERQANYDSLTGLPNRNLLQERLQHSLARARRNQRQVAVLFVDLERFKRINDNLGHSAGDALLQAVAGRFSACLREGDTVARAGGDQFVLVLEDLPTNNPASLISHKLQAAIKAPFPIAQREIFIRARAGISLYPRHGEDPSILLKQAEMALHWAKEQGQHGLQFYKPAMNTPAAKRFTLEHSLRSALEREELVLYYQPQVDLVSGRIIGVEALVRWRHPQRGLLPPAEFISLAEETGLIIPLGQWVLHTACAQAQAWQAEGLPPLTLAVNLSAQQFLHTDLIEQITQALAQTGLAAGQLGLEITESLLMENVKGAAALLGTLKEMGIQIAIDDFGTGYSSLNYLKRFSLDLLKIDRSFVRDLPDDSTNVAIVQAIIALAQSLNLKVIAEGVETEAQMAFLWARHCHAIQGYYFSPPLPAEKFAYLLRKNPRLAWTPGAEPHHACTLLLGDEEPDSHSD